MIRLKENYAIFENFLLSCRIIGRKIEEKFISEIIKDLKKMKIKKVKSSYIKTKKNIQVKNFYDEIGFNLISKTKDEKNYECDLDKFEKKNINHIKLENEK